jgi:hypothetical protein
MFEAKTENIENGLRPEACRKGLEIERDEGEHTLPFGLVNVINTR